MSEGANLSKGAASATPEHVTAAAEAGIKPILDLSNDPILIDALVDPHDQLAEKTLSPIPALAYRADVLLTEAGVETTIDGDHVVATKESSPVQLGNRIVYARLARKVRNKDFDADLPSIVFCKEASFEDIHTTKKYFSPLTFINPFADQVALVAGTGKNNDINQEKHVKDAETIITDLEKQREKSQKEQAEQIAAAERVAQEQREQEQRESAARSKKRHDLVRSALSLVMISASGAALLYGPQLIDSGHIDAKIGPVPMPDFVEWFVDWNNGPDHTAQGFRQPAGALPIAPGKAVGDIPLLPNYKTHNAPNANVLSAANNSNGVQSRAGLYKSYVTFNPNGKSPEAIDSNGCFKVTGDFEPGRTEVFTQTVNFNRAVTLKVVSGKILEVCKGNIPENFGFAGSFFLYQNH